MSTASQTPVDLPPPASEIGSPSAQQRGIPSPSIPHAVPQPEADKGELESPECGETTVKSTDQGTDGAEQVFDLSQPCNICHAIDRKVRFHVFFTCAAV